MKANMPKCFNQLSPGEKQRIENAICDRLDNELCEAQFVWIKMACAILHNMGLTESQITQFIGLWKAMYRANSRFKNKQEQDAFLDARMAEIFGEGGFPEEFMQSMKDIGR